MWQRGGSRQPAISSPYQFVELDRDGDYYDDRYLETIHEVDSISSRRQSLQYGLPELPFRAVPPMNEIPQPVNVQSPMSPTTRTAISRDHGLRIDVNRHVPDRTDAGEISPLTPRNLRHRQSVEEQPISPIEKNVPTHFQGRAPLRETSTFVSQIPRKVSQPQDQKIETKWDEYSGEPTTDDRGKAASMRPGAQLVESDYPHLKERTKQILAGLREREAAEPKKWGRPPPPVAADPLDDPPQREPWKGQSGRATIVEPVKNTAVTRKVVPPARQPESLKPVATLHESATEPPLHEHPAFRKQPRQVSSEESLKPIVPLKTRNLTPDTSNISPVKGPTQPIPTESPPASPDPFISRTPPADYIEDQQYRVESPQYDPEPTTPTTPEPSILSTSDKFLSSPPTYSQPELDREVSRFSWTTYTTSAADSPRSMARHTGDMSPLPEMPELPPTLLVKKRPVSTSPFMQSQPYSNAHYADSTGSVVRKPIAKHAVRTSSLTSATSRAMSTSKSLPPTPTVMEAGDKIENLEAQLDSLNRRKYNISRIVYDLETSLKKNAVAYDMWRRREVEKNIINHKMSLDEIGREIHELSLQLHRSQRKRDEKEGLEASSLWIKRVTS